MNGLRAFFSNRYGLTFLVGHWVLFGIGVYLRGGPLRLFAHFRYEPLLLKVLTVLDLPAIFIGDLISGTALQGLSDSQALIYTTLISIQWILIGYIVKQTVNALSNMSARMT